MKATYTIMPDGSWNLYWHGYDWFIKREDGKVLASGSSFSAWSAKRSVKKRWEELKNPKAGYIYGELE